jgi:hypothetical protein
MLKIEHSYVVVWAKKIKALKLIGEKCSICGENRLWLLLFHHTDPTVKEFSMVELKTYRWSIIEKEIKKCVVVCYNCHKELHHIDKNTKSQINKKVCLDFLNSYSCGMCGYSSCNEALDFHHTKDKKFAIANYINSTGYYKTTDDLRPELKEELKKCSILCSNCHHDIHFNKEKLNKFKPTIDRYDYKEMPKPVDKNLLIKLYKNNVKQIEIARILNCTKSTVCGVLKRIAEKNLLKSITEIKECPFSTSIGE